MPHLGRAAELPKDVAAFLQEVARETTKVFYGPR